MSKYAQEQSLTWFPMCRFEALCTKQDTVDATSEYAALVRLRLDKLRIILAAEIDCFDPEAPATGLPSYVELKTYQ